LPRAVLVIGAGAAGLIAFGRSREESFVNAVHSAGHRGDVAMRGFKDDFMAWKATLTPEERRIQLKQAQNEFNKKYKSTDEYNMALPEEKLNGLRDIVSKFIQSEQEDYKKMKKAMNAEEDNDLIEGAIARQNLNFEIAPRLIEIDRTAERRYFFASQRFQHAKETGGEFWPASPISKRMAMDNTGDAHMRNLRAVNAMVEGVKKDSSVDPETMKAIEEFAASVPADGTPWNVQVPVKLEEYINNGEASVDKALIELEAEMGADAFKKWSESDEGKKEIAAVRAELLSYTTKKFIEGYLLVDNDVKQTLEWFRSAEPMPGKTKADVARALWQILKESGQKVGPLDEEILADLTKYPAYLEGEYKHSFGTADKLWKMEAVDPFGSVFLLGIFETRQEALDVFNSWNLEYEAAKIKMNEEVAIWEKKDAAKLEANRDDQARLIKTFDDARAEER